MEKRPVIPSASRRIGYAIATLVLVAVGGLLTGGVFLAQHMAETAEPDDRVLYGRLAWAALVGLAIVVILLASIMLRWLAAGMQQRRIDRDEQSDVDAWTLSGQRMKVDREEGPGEEGDSTAGRGE
jgi:membrane protein implicated in regulation of membrane protease activity